MPISFPANPSVNDTYSSGNRTWRWNGSSWMVVTGTALAGNVGTNDIADSAITTAKIAAGAVVEADIANNAVTTSKIASGVVTQAHLHSTVSAVTICTSSTRPASPFNGQMIYETDADRLAIWDASNWVFYGPGIQSYDFSGTIQFGTCGSTGSFGPSLSSAQSSYSGQPFSSTWLNNARLYNCAAGVQYWTVPKTGTYTIRVAGARSGPSTHGGLGIDITSTYSLVAMESLKIVCGQRGEGNSGVYGGGGGASYAAVFRCGEWIPLLVAGGGAGVSNNSPQSTNTNRNGFNPSVRSSETSGGAGSWYDKTYNTQIGDFWVGGGGGGWGSDGGNGTINIYASNQETGGRMISSSSPIGGIYYLNSGTTYNGGFGGGGATGRDGGSAGGGGGWWGGNATYSTTTQTSDDSTHLGGGSYSQNPTYTVNGTNNGEGFVHVAL